MNLSQASILLFAAMPSLSVGLEVSSHSALLQMLDKKDGSTHDHEESRRRLGKRTERSKAKKRMFSSSSSSDDLLPPFTNPKPKDVCIQEMQAYKIKGSGTPIVGPTKDNPVCPPGTLSDAFMAAVAGGSSQPLDDYLSCLATPAAGPVISGKWWFNRDIPSPAPPATENSGQFRFEPGYVCTEITGIETDSRTKFELWEDAYIGLPLANFTEFSVEYEIRDLGTGSTGSTFNNEAYVNVYMRADPLTTTGDNFYDCRLDFLAQDSSLFTSGDATRELVIDHTTTTTSFGKRNGFECGDSSPYSIGGFLSKYPDAVFGVGNGELYTFTLDTGSTGQDNQGLEVCWANVMISTTNEFGDQPVEGYAFDVL